MSRVFISYRRDDSGEIVGRLNDHLVKELGSDQVFRDIDSIPPACDFRTYLLEELTKCKALIAVIGPDWLSAKIDGKRRLDDPDDYVRQELEFALEREASILPVLVKGASAPHPSDLPERLRRLAYLNAVSLRGDPDFASDVGKILKGLQGVGIVRPRIRGARQWVSRPGCTISLTVSLALLFLLVYQLAGPQIISWTGQQYRYLVYGSKRGDPGPVRPDKPIQVAKFGQVPRIVKSKDHTGAPFFIAPEPESKAPLGNVARVADGTPVMEYIDPISDNYPGLTPVRVLEGSLKDKYGWIPGDCLE